MRSLMIAFTASALLFAAGCRKPENEENEKHETRQEKSAATEKNAEQNVIKLDEEAVAASRIQTAEVRPGSGLVTVRFPGNFTFNLNATAVVQPPIESRLQEWRINIGDRVKKDDVLARVENPQNLGTPILLKTPLDGEIIERNAAVGDWVKPGDKIAIVTDLDTMWVTARVREDMAGKILTAESAAIRVLSFADETFTGKLLRVGASVDAETRTVEFVFAVQNPERKLRAGMFAQVSLATDRVQKALLVPDEAVQSVKDRSVIFVEQKRGEYRIMPVRLGRKLGESYEVLEGLTNSTRVVTTGSFVLKSEALRSTFSGDHD